MDPTPTTLETNFTEIGTPTSTQTSTTDTGVAPNTPASAPVTSNILTKGSDSVMSNGDFYSSNYSAGNSGWRIRSNGDVEFAGGNFRGSININNGVASISVTGEAVFTNATLYGSLTLNGLLGVARYKVANLPTISASTAANDTTVGTVVWSNPNNAKVYTGFLTSSDDSTGVAVISEYLKITNFGYAVPTTATILGIQVEILKFKRAATLAVDNSIVLVKANGTFSSANRADVSTSWPTNGNGETVVHGGPTDLWGETWTPADINNSNFGAAVSSAYTNSTSLGGPGVGLVRVVVFYSGQTAAVGMGSVAFAINGLKNGESAGSGTGLLVIHDGRTWKCSDRSATTVTA